MEDLLGRHSDEQSGKGHEKHRQQTYTLSSKTQIQYILHTSAHSYFSNVFSSSLVFHLILILFDYLLCLLSSVVLSHSLQRGSNYGSLLTADGNFQVFAKTGYFKVSF